MRATGNTVAGGPTEAVTVDLPREERISREEARARIAAGAARRNVAATSPFAAARAAEAADPERAAAVKAVAPAPTARPKPTPALVEVRSATDLLAARRVDVAGIVQDYLDGDTVAAIAERRGHTATTVRRVLADTPGLTMRSERGETPAAQEARRIAAEALRADIAATGLTTTELRQWAREHDVPVSPRGSVGRSVLDAYLATIATQEATPTEPAPARAAEAAPEHEQPQPTPEPAPIVETIPDPTPAARDHIANRHAPRTHQSPPTPPQPYVPHALAAVDQALPLVAAARTLGTLLLDVATAVETLVAAAAAARDLAIAPDTPEVQAARRAALAGEPRRRPA